MSYYWDEFLSPKIVRWMYSNMFSTPIIICNKFYVFEKIHKWPIFFMKKICGVKFSKSKKMSKVVLYMCNNVSEGSKGSYLLPSNLLHSGITFSLIPTNFSTTVAIFHFPCANHMDVKFFGMSSYRLESSSIIKCGTWRLFYIYSTSSYLL